LATKNAKNLTAAMQALAAVKSPAEFIELQHPILVNEGPTILGLPVRESQQPKVEKVPRFFRRFARP
jgi:hypothetical protein